MGQGGAAWGLPPPGLPLWPVEVTPEDRVVGELCETQIAVHSFAIPLLGDPQPLLPACSGPQGLRMDTLAAPPGCCPLVFAPLKYSWPTMMSYFNCPDEELNNLHSF